MPLAGQADQEEGGAHAKHGGEREGADLRRPSTKKYVSSGQAQKDASGCVSVSLSRGPLQLGVGPRRATPWRSSGFGCSAAVSGCLGSRASSGALRGFGPREPQTRHRAMPRCGTRGQRDTQGGRRRVAQAGRKGVEVGRPQNGGWGRPRASTVLHAARVDAEVGPQEGSRHMGRLATETATLS